MSNFVELTELRTVDHLMRVILNLNMTNRCMIKNAYESGWITDNEYEFLKNHFEGTVKDL
jgi:hypothetical protein